MNANVSFPLLIIKKHSTIAQKKIVVIIGAMMKKVGITVVRVAVESTREIQRTIIFGGNFGRNRQVKSNTCQSKKTSYLVLSNLSKVVFVFIVVF